MKKYIRYISILPVLLLTIFCFWGCSCSEERVQRVSLSITEGENVTYLGLNRYEVVWDTDNPYVEINASIYPTSFSVDNLEWSSSSPSVATFMNRNRGLLTCLRDGSITITATYKTSYGDVSSSIFVDIVSASSTRFPKTHVQREYTGLDQKDNFTVINAPQDEENYFYRYFDNETGENVNEIKNAGEYDIVYYELTTEGETQSTIIIDQMSVTIMPYTLIQKAEDGASTFGGELEDGFHESDLVTDTLLQEQGEDILLGVGDDMGIPIGKYVYSTSASQGSNVGAYSTNYEYVLFDDYKDNYSITRTSGIYTISARNVVIKVENQNLTYMTRPQNENYSLYDYDEYAENNNSIFGLRALSNEDANFSDCIEVTNYVYYQNGEQRTVNEWGYLNVGTYVVTYLNPTSNNNLNIEEVLSGEFVVSSKSVTVTPTANLSKVYGEEDDLSSLTYSVSSGVIEDEIQPFLNINYMLSLESDFVLTTGNANAPVGVYYYSVDNTVNPNYNFSLVEEASPEYGNENNRIVFTVNAGSIEVEFEGYSGNYVSPNNNIEHVVSYYNNVSADFILGIKSFKINDEEMVEDGTVTCVSEDFESTGMFVLATGEQFRISLRLLPDIVQKGYYETYRVDYSSSYYELGLDTNYTISVVPSYINLAKITLTLTPNSTNSSKIYDNSSSVDSISNFLSSYSISGNIEEDVTIQDIVSETTLLSLLNQNGYYVKVNDLGQESEEQSFRNAGKYKVFLSSDITFLTGMEYYEFELDSRQDYYFTVTPKNITIIPDSGQSKYYGAQDPELTYTISEITQVYEDGSPRDGTLSRVSGENAGIYEINLGTLSFGENYNLRVQTGVNFTIQKRDITVTPYSYTTTYGSNEVSTISYNIDIDVIDAGVYDENILVAPVFSGEFVLQYEGEDIVKIGGYYPVVYNDEGKVDSYLITTGTFKLGNDTSMNNYNLTVVETSTFRVTPRDVVINIMSSNSSDVDENSPINLVQGTHYSLTPSLTSNTTISIVAEKLKSDNDRYIIESIDDLTITLSVEGVSGTDIEKIRNSYNFSLGENVLYYVNSSIVSFRLVARGTNSSTAELIYDGASMRDEFVLVCLDSNYILADESTYTVVFSTTTEQDLDPINVGGYNVSVKLEEGQSLILKNASSGDTVTTFTSFGVSNSDHYIATVSQYGYLMINRATISCNSNLVAFNGSITYGEGVDDLPNVVEDVDGEKVFSGVLLDSGENEEISLFVEGDKNFEYVSSSSPLEMLNAGSTHYVTVRVRASKGGELDNNYASLQIEVPLVVDRREIVISSSPAPSFIPPVEEGEVVYNGMSMYYTLSLSTDINNYSVTYSYVLLDTDYSSSSTGYVLRFTTNGSTVSPMLDEDGTQLSYSITELQNMIDESITIQNIGGEYYVVVNLGDVDECYRVSQREDVTPRNAGVYVCLATCSSDQNYILSYLDIQNSNMQFSNAFEIQKSQEIEIENWKQDFYYGNTFNVGNVSTLPFEYTMSPNYKDSVQFVTNNYEEWAAVNFVLGVGNYSVTMVIENDNYYYSENLAFNVKSLEAEFIFPADNRFVYRVEPIISFLSDISVVLKDMNGNNVQIVDYTEDVSSFTFEYFNEDGTECESVPSEVGVYTLRAYYGAETEEYYGAGEFTYEIVKRAYTGVVRANDLSRPYNSTYKASDIYDFMLDMFECSEDPTSYTLIIVDDNNPEIVFSPNDESWVANINNCASSKRIRFIMQFNDGVTADREIRANLTFTRIALTNDSLQVVNQNTTYSYTGYPIYKQLVYNGVDLSPGEAGTTSQIISQGVTYNIEYLENYRITLRDALNNLIFTLEYDYSVYTNDTDYIATDIPPTSPSDFKYRVDYNFVEFGTNYERNFSNLSYFEFSINKINSIYISMNSLGTQTFTGEDMANLITDASINVSSSSSSSQSNMKVTILYNPSQGSSISYTEEQGVCLVVRYKNSRGSFVSEMRNVDTYQIVISFLYLPGGYNLSKYFNYVYFGSGNAISVSQFTSASDNLMYDIALTTTLTISQAESIYNDDNIESAFDIEGNYYFNTEGSSPVLYFDNETQIILNNSQFRLGFYQDQELLEYTSFAELPEVLSGEEEYRLVVYDEEGNYMDYEITVIKVASISSTSGV